MSILVSPFLVSFYMPRVINTYGDVVMDLRVRVANQNDLMLVYRWANDPLTREMNFKQGIIPLDTCARLFTTLLHDGDIFFLIVEGFELLPNHYSCPDLNVIIELFDVMVV